MNLSYSCISLINNKRYIKILILYSIINLNIVKDYKSYGKTYTFKTSFILSYFLFYIHIPLVFLSIFTPLVIILSDILGVLVISSDLIFNFDSNMMDLDGVCAGFIFKDPIS